MTKTNDDLKGARGAIEVLLAFLTLGLTAFGGPVAHLGYFREAFVVRRKWLGEEAYGDLVALCQFLPGPASSQVGMALGLHRAGYAGMLAAWVGFTLPSALLMVLFAYGLTAFGADMEAGWVVGLKAAAVAVVAHAVLGMARSLAPDGPRAGIAVGGMVIALLVPTVWGQVLVIALGAIAGLMFVRPDQRAADAAGLHVPVSRAVALGCLAVFTILLLVLPLLASGNSRVALFDSFYRAGSLVFGGGHVVLPLLEAEMVQTELVGREAFLAGYGAVQAVPGPLFTFAAYLGAMTQSGPTGVAGALIALAGIFLPSALLLLGALPFWNALSAIPLARRAMGGVNAAVVGLLAGALYDPVFVAGVVSPATMAVAAVAFVALAVWRVPAWAVVGLAGIVGFAVL